LEIHFGVQQVIVELWTILQQPSCQYIYNMYILYMYVNKNAVYRSRIYICLNSYNSREKQIKNHCRESFSRLINYHYISACFPHVQTQWMQNERKRTKQYRTKERKWYKREQLFVKKKENKTKENNNTPWSLKSWIRLLNGNRSAHSLHTCSK